MEYKKKDLTCMKEISSITDMGKPFSYNNKQDLYRSMGMNTFQYLKGFLNQLNLKKEKSMQYDPHGMISKKIIENRIMHMNPSQEHIGKQLKFRDLGRDGGSSKNNYKTKSTRETITPEKGR